MKYTLGLLAAVAIAGVALVQPAQARCFWNGVETVCYHHPQHFGFYRGGYVRPYWWGGY